MFAALQLQLWRLMELEHREPNFGSASEVARPIGLCGLETVSNSQHDFPGIDHGDWPR